MNVTIFGASGQTGLFLVERALQRDHEVTAYVRTPETFAISHKKLKVVKGDVRSRRDVAKTVKGADAVMCAIGERLGLVIVASVVREICSVEHDLRGQDPVALPLAFAHRPVIDVVRLPEAALSDHRDAEVV